MRRRDHPEGAAELRPRGEHGRTLDRRLADRGRCCDAPSCFSTSSRGAGHPPSPDLVFDSVPTCARCGGENPDGAKFCNACGAALERAGTDRRGAANRVRALRRPRRLDRQGGEARPRGRARLSQPLLRARPRRGGAFRRRGREVHRGRGDGRLRGADDLRRRSGAGRSRSACGSRLGGGGRTPAQDRREHRRGDRRARCAARTGPGDDRRRRRQHRGTPAVCRAHRLRPRRRGHVPQHQERHRVPACPAGEREGEGRSDPGVACPRRELGRRRAARDTRADDRARSRGRGPDTDLGARRRRGPRALRDHLRPGGHREVATCARDLAARRGTRRARRPRALDALRREQPVQRVRAAGQAGRDDLRQRRSGRGADEARRRRVHAGRPGGGRGARSSPGDPARPR